MISINKTGHLFPCLPPHQTEHVIQKATEVFCSPPIHEPNSPTVIADLIATGSKRSARIRLEVNMAKYAKFSNNHNDRHQDQGS